MRFASLGSGSKGQCHPGAQPAIHPDDGRLRLFHARNHDGLEAWRCSPNNRCHPGHPRARIHWRWPCPAASSPVLPHPRLLHRTGRCDGSHQLRCFNSEDSFCHGSSTGGRSPCPRRQPWATPQARACPLTDLGSRPACAGQLSRLSQPAAGIQPRPEMLQAGLPAAEAPGGRRLGTPQQPGRPRSCCATSAAPARAPWWSPMSARTTTRGKGREAPAVRCWIPWTEWRVWAEQAGGFPGWAGWSVGRRIATPGAIALPAAVAPQPAVRAHARIACSARRT